MYIVYATSNTLYTRTYTESEKEKTIINNHLDSSSTCAGHGLFFQTTIGLYP